ncbi:hypothetical protein A2763_01000 [Candidatus Kaiserbacteria bacterium RIFCSPHIGHO2_01_FULL_54_36]|uniref:Glycosyltransferase 2-like domain-containing protein n=1 Tax=Candidatus Kaiserbacteria bacterium RIFCSPHIGHO2_01_FULL_54_36 TaxID=1798482 RepID=A0A1F6CKY2_9BACT|nr:MAG: hypothetical protein A2763_01000 [Candidatus Kaiserbacteria bacterium RIFCSPHIGHO2_01_FULL_54_36]OGG75283.1 MAG: hypothetical protein A3A41_03240 [Candidatus Kaiserbacteria bacterium RIFCSPLOWO2_01_FULL_54_22]
MAPHPSARQSLGSRGNIRSFILPHRYARSSFEYEQARVTAIIPTYKPENLTVKLVEDLVEWNPTLRIIVVDDCTPEEYIASALFIRMGSVSDRVTVLRTPVNKMKAAALNYALAYIFANEEVPDVILSLDDDIVVAPSTVRNLVVELMSYQHLGAVCSQCRVLNKNNNMLTRLQGLEYVGFNATRLADEGFYRGPLVMHGMLTAFRVAALKEVQGFADGHLIEDYEITTRLKDLGWSVKLALNAPAWTVVPDTFSKLWRQRARWSYGGITVITKTKYFSSVLQDLIGHSVFFATVGMIALMALFRGDDRIPIEIARLVIALSFLQLLLWYSFQLWLMRLYKEKDARDWIIRISMVPEFIYTNILTLVVVGSYFFLTFNVLTRRLRRSGNVVARRCVAIGAVVFSFCGYMESWGTRGN